jgi:hypothetical protein
LLLRRALSAAPALAVGAAVLAVGTAAAPDRGRHVVKHLGPRLVAKPGRLASINRLAPGDRVSRVVELRKRGPGRFAAVYFVAHRRNASLLASDHKNGLRVSLRSCPKRWKRRHGRYVCSRRTKVVLATRPLVGRKRLRHLKLKGTRPVHLLLVVSLPASAGNALQGQSTRVKYSFVGVARRR